MDVPRDPNVTDLLCELSAGNAAAAHRLAPLVETQLRALVSRHMAGERPNPALQTTGIADEAFMRLVDQSRVDWNGRAHFFSVAAGVIRRLLIDYARADAAEKRNPGGIQLSIDAAEQTPARTDAVDALALHESLNQLAERDQRQARVVELRYFGGLSVDQTAAVLGVSPRTVKDDWRVARAWLRDQLT